MSAQGAAQVFISYAREDVEFVERLAVDLKTRGFDPWVDRKRLEGGVLFEKSIQRAIEKCSAFALVMSPDAAQSTWVASEFSRARLLNKFIVPLLYRPVDDREMPLGWGIYQRIDIMTDYSAGLRQLSDALAHGSVAVREATGRDANASQKRHGFRIPLWKSRPEPPRRLSIEEKKELYRRGVRAYEDGDLEEAERNWGKVVADDPSFMSGGLQRRLRELGPKLRNQRIQRLRQSVEQAGSEGDWQQEHTSWSALAKMIKLSPRERFRMQSAADNQKYQDTYDTIVGLVAQGSIAEAAKDLMALWSAAPNYGDPAALGAKLGIKTPEQVRKERDEERTRQLAEKATRRQRKQAEKEAKRRQQLAEQEAKRGQQLAEQEARRRQQLAAYARRKRQWETDVQTAPGFVNRVLAQSPVAIWVSLPCLLVGGGCLIGLLTQAVIPALVTTVGIAVVAYGAGYRRTIEVVPLLTIVVISAAASSVVGWQAIRLPLPPLRLPFSFFGFAPVDGVLLFVVLFTAAWTLLGTLAGCVVGISRREAQGGSITGAAVGVCAGLVMALMSGGRGWLQSGLLLGSVAGIVVGWIAWNVPSRAAAEAIAMAVGGLLAISLVNWGITSGVFAQSLWGSILWGIGLLVGGGTGIGLASLLYVCLKASGNHPFPEKPPSDSYGGTGVSRPGSPRRAGATVRDRRSDRWR